MRNKPKEPPKVPKAAPFFLPTIAGLQPKFDIQDDKDEGDKVSHSFHSTPHTQPVLHSLKYQS